MRTRARSYFAFALAWSTAFWAAAALGSGGADPPASLLFLIGGAGPCIAALFLTHVRESRAVQRDFWLRLVDVRRLSWPWWAIALLLHPALVGLAVAADAALGGGLPEADRLAAGPLDLLALAFFVFWFGPLPEEIGWRGFALDRLQGGHGALRASLLLGSVWAVWHLPLFFVPGTFQAELGAGSLRFWIFMATLLPLSVLMTWIYNHTGRSTLSAVLVHFSGNFCGALLAKSERLAALELAMLTVAAIVVVSVWGARRLAAPEVWPYGPAGEPSRPATPRTERIIPTG